MAWTALTYAFESILTSSKMAQNQANFAALAAGEAGAPDVNAFGVRAGTGIVLKTKVLDIGDWNMDTTSALNVAHGLTLSTIRNVQVFIRSDSAAVLSPLINGVANGGNFDLDSTNVQMSRIASGAFDSVSYDSTAYNRGWIVIDYV